MPFEGTRVETVADLSSKSSGTAVYVFIDGKKPSEFPECYNITRPNADPEKDWPWQTGAVIRVQWNKPLILEDWAITIMKIYPGRNYNFDFSVEALKDRPVLLWIPLDVFYGNVLKVFPRVRKAIMHFCGREEKG